MTRLLNSMREKITDNLMVHSFLPRCEQKMVEQAQLAAAVYDDFYSGKEREVINGLPAGWLSSWDYVRCRVDENDLSLNFNGWIGSGPVFGVLIDASVKRPEKTERRFASCDGGRYVKVYEGNKGLGKRLLAYSRDCGALDEQLRDARRKAEATLAKFTTVEKLIETWPEIEPMTVGVCAPAPASLPALATDTLNNMFGLPVAS
jgi:hypothetical protein